jgi:hypothetical protein
MLKLFDMHYPFVLTFMHLNGPDSRGTMADDVTNIILDTVENWESFV